MGPSRTATRWLGRWRRWLGAGRAESRPARPCDLDQCVAELERRRVALALGDPGSRVSGGSAVAASIHYRRCFEADPPLHGGRSLDPVAVEPGRLPGPVPVSTLLDVAHPPSAQCAVPAWSAMRLWQSVPTERSRPGGMLEDSTPPTHGLDRGREHAAILVATYPVPRLNQPRELTPPRARRMRNHRMRTGIARCVSILWPRVDARHVRVAPVGLHEQSGDGLHGCNSLHATAAARAARA
jgi:hypothetical protein